MANWQESVKQKLDEDLKEYMPRKLRDVAQAAAPPPAVAYSPDCIVDPIINGLLAHLPAPGEVWPEDKRKLWISLVENSFKLIYRERDDAG